MPKYTVNNKVYNIPDDKIGAFTNKYPNATVEIYDNDGRGYNLPLSKVDSFQKKFNGWSYEGKNPALPAQEQEPDGYAYMFDDKPQIQRDSTSPFAPGNKAGMPQESQFNFDDEPQHRLSRKERKEALKHAKERREAREAALRDQFEQSGGYKQISDIKERAEQTINDNKVAPYIGGGVVGLVANDVVNWAAGLFNKDVRAAQATKTKAEETQDMIKEARHADGGFLDKQVGGVFRGLADGATRVGTWDFGVTGIADAAELSSVYKKFEAGEELSSNEQDLLDMMGLAAAAQSGYGNQVGVGYNVGTSLPESAGFMASMATNPAGGLAKKAVKKFGTTTAKKIAARIAGDVAEMAAMTVTTGAGRVAEDYFNRVNGSATYDVDENGIIRYGGREEQEEAVNAIFKALGSQFIENYSEAVGEYFDPLKGFIDNMATKGLKRAHLDDIADALQNIKSSQWSKAVDGFAEKTKFNGTIGEYLEEVIGNTMNALTVGDMTFALPGREGYEQSVFNAETNLTTLLSCALMTGAINGVRAGGSTIEKGRITAATKRAAAEIEADCANDEQKYEWSQLRDRIDAATPSERVAILQEELADTEAGSEWRRKLLNYAVAMTREQEFNSRVAANRDEMTEEARNAMSAYDNGYHRDSMQQMNDAKNLYESALQKVQNAGIGEVVIKDIDSNPVSAVETIRLNQMGWSKNKQRLALDYVYATQMYNGMLQRVRDDIDGRIMQSDVNINANIKQAPANVATETDGGLHTVDEIIQTVKLKNEKNAYVISGNLVQLEDESGIDRTKSDDSIIIRDAETGKLEMISASDVANIESEINAGYLRAATADSIRQQFAQEAVDNINGKVTFQAGQQLTYTNDKDEVIPVTVVSDDGEDTILVTDGKEQFPIERQVFQAEADAANVARMYEYEQQKEEERLASQNPSGESEPMQYAADDVITIQDENGNIIRGSITDVDIDGNYEVMTESPLNGKRVQLLTREQLDAMVVNQNEGLPIPKAEASVPEGIPLDADGNPIYEQAATPDIAWDTLVEQTGGDASIAQSVAEDMVKDKQRALKKLEKTTVKTGVTVTEKIEAEKERKAAIDAAKAELAIWQNIAQTQQRRKTEEMSARRRAAEQEAALRKAEEEKAQAEREEAARIERESLNGVPDMADDTPQDARARGFRRVTGHKIDRQEPLQHLQGKKVGIKFSNDLIQDGHISVIDASQLQPSHIQGHRNPAHFIDEAQPKERNDEVSVMEARKIASNIRPEEITSSVTAYTGAPTVNSRGEVIQGNNRSAALRWMWESEPEQAEKYRQYIKDHAEEFGLTADAIESMQNPVLVNMVDVDDNDAIKLGQYVAQNTESGGIERIKPKNAVQKMGADMRTFADMLLASSDEDTSFGGLVDRNGAEVLGWMTRNGHITPTQYKSAFDTKGAITAEAKNDLKGIMYQSIFKGGNTRLEEMFNAMPAKAQRAILATAYRDYDSPNVERMLDEIQNSIRAYNALSQDADFASAKNWKEAREAVESWKIQYAMDDVTGESYLPADKFSNFALHLATMYKGQSQSFIQGTFNQMYDLIQGTQEENLFEKPDNTPRTLVEAIKEVLNIDYNGQQRSNALAGGSAAGSEREQRSTGDSASGERTESGERTVDDSGRTSGVRGRSRDKGKNRSNQKTDEIIGRSMTADEADSFIAGMEKSAEIAPKLELTPDNWLSQFGESGEVNTPIGIVKMGENQYFKLARDGRNEKLGMVKPTLEHPSVIIEDYRPSKDGKQERPTSYVFIKTFVKEDGSRFYYFMSVSVLKDGQEVIISNEERLANRISKLLQNGNVAWIDKEFSLHPTTQIEESVPLNDSNKPTLTDSQPALLGVNSSEPISEELLSNSSDNHLAEDDAHLPDLLPTQDSNDISKGGEAVQTAASKPHGDQTTSADKGSDSKQKNKGKGEKVTEDKGDTIKFLVSDDRMAELKRRMREKLGQLNMGVDPELLAIGTELAVGHIERGARKFVDYAKAMIADIGDAVRPYLKSFYNAVRDMPEAEDYASDMTSYEDVRTFNVASIGENGEDVQPDVFETAAQVANEDTVNRNEKGLAVVVSDEEKTTEQSYSITPAQYTTKKGKVLDMFLVTPASDMDKETYKAASSLAKEMRGWYDRASGGFMLRSEDDARQFAVQTFGSPIGNTSSPAEIQAQRETTNVKPTDRQKTAGNYAKGHIKVDGFDISLENPKGSTRSGKDADGKEWSNTMNYDYGYIRRTEGVDGDHIDLYLSDNPTGGNVYVVDQINQNDGSFDEHKVMYGFPSLEAAREAYASQYEKGWKIGTITEVSRDEFKKWIDSSYRKTKPFAEYRSVKPISGQSATPPAANYTTLLNRIASKVASLEWIVNTYRDSSPQQFGDIVRTLLYNEEIPDALHENMQAYLDNGVAKAIMGSDASMKEAVERVLSDVEWMVEQNVEKQKADERKAKKQAILERNNAHIGDKYTYEGKEVTLYDVDEYGGDAVIDTGLAPVLYVRASFDELTPLNNNKNGQSDEISEQERTDSETLVSEAEALADKTESDVEAATTEGTVNQVVSAIDSKVEEINEQLALLGYYQADQNSAFHESYGYMRSAEALAVKDANNLAAKLIKDLGIDPEKIVIRGKKTKKIAYSNIAPIGGDVYMHLPITDNAGLYVNIGLDKQDDDSLKISRIMYRLENPLQDGSRRFGNNEWLPDNVTYGDFLKAVRSEIKHYVPEFKPVEVKDVPRIKKSKAVESAENKRSKDRNADNNSVSLFDETKGYFYSGKEVSREEQKAKEDYIAANASNYAKKAFAKSPMFNDLTLKDVKALTRIYGGEIVPVEELQQLDIVQRAEDYNNSTPRVLEPKTEPTDEQRDYFRRVNDRFLETAADKSRERKAWIVVGLPSSGKSSAIVNNLLQEHNAFEFDNDTIKSMMDEFNGGRGANSCQDASSWIADNLSLPQLTEQGVNLAIPIVGKNIRAIRKKYQGLKDAGYDISIYNVLLPREKAINRAVTRFVEKGRYVSIRTYLNTIDPQTINDAFNEAIELEGVSYYEEFDNDVPFGEKARSVRNSEGVHEGQRTGVQGGHTEDDRLRGRESGREVPDTDAGSRRADSDKGPVREDLPSGLRSSEHVQLAEDATISDDEPFGNLFSSLLDEESLTNNNSENGLQGVHELRSGRMRSESSERSEGRSGGKHTETVRKEESQRADERAAEGSGRTGGEIPQSDRRQSGRVQGLKNVHNNHSERGKDYAPTSVDARIKANLEAIELSHKLLESGEQATPARMEILRKFSGWGGLGKVFNERANYTEGNRQYWNEPTPENKRLQQLLGAEAYQEAVLSSKSAYYTPAYVVDTLWDIAEKMGFKGGKILEGSAGIGNILGQMPEHISERSDIHAVEIDRTTGGILSLLYPDAKVNIQGFEATRVQNGSVDLAITNVPFVTGLHVNDSTGDSDLSKKFRNIHDFCIAKNVRKLREGGLGIFITSNGTLDNSKKLRDWVTGEGGADFVGAFRMNNKTFGGTPVTSDIIVIRKRVNGKKSANAIDVSSSIAERVAEFDTGTSRKVKGQDTPIVKKLPMDYNRYFIEHPEMMAGEMKFNFEQGETFRPEAKGLFPISGKDQSRMLADFVNSFKEEEPGQVSESIPSEDELNARIYESLGDNVKEGSMVVDKNDRICIAQGGQAVPVRSVPKKGETASEQALIDRFQKPKVKGHLKSECFKSYSAIKDALAEVMSYQAENEDNDGLKPLLNKLNKAYDDFVSTYGHFNKNTAIAFLRKDVDYANIFSLEKYEKKADNKGDIYETFEKTDVFKQRVVEKVKEPNPTNVKDGLVASMFKFGRIDVPYIAEQLGKTAEEVRNEILSKGYGFENPANKQVEFSYLYLSGNVREKLRQAEENNENGLYDKNIKALTDVLPKNIPAHLIDFTLGSSWLDSKLYDDYVKERTGIDVTFTSVGGTWFMNAPQWNVNGEQNRAMGVYSEQFKSNILGHTLIEAAIQNKTITVSRTLKHYDGSTETIVDRDATQACSNKIDEIRQDFKEWARQKMQSNQEMSAQIERIYNDTFNNYVPMEIPEEFAPKHFAGATQKFEMRPHQSRAIVRGTMQPLLLAHEVGTGKTFTLISTAMEMRRLGTARKPMIVVQNATVGQFVAEAKSLYPNAKILTLEEADRGAEGRKNFYAKIRYNDWDMIVVPQSTFEFIPDSEERQMRFIQDKIEEKMLVLEKMKEADPRGGSIITRQAEKEIANLRDQLASLSEESTKKRSAKEEQSRAVAKQNAEVRAREMLDRRTDDVENFDDMGIDALLIDEAHEYKHLGFATAMQRGVKGVDPSYSKKSQGVYLKTQAVLEKNNGRNVVFATGTPISNTAAEIWTFMRYLMPADKMKEYGIYYFDDFVRNFGNIQQMLEFTTSGKFKENNRFAGYCNLPELVRIWSEIADTVLTDEAGEVKNKIPELEGGKAQDIYLPQTRALRSVMKFVKAELKRYEEMSGKEKKQNSHIPLTMYGIAKAAAVDARLVSDAEDDPNSKTNEAVRQTLRSLNDSKKYRGTVAIFSDIYQNKHSGFNLYDDIRNKLIEQGVPADEVVVIRSGMSIKKKLEIFEKVNRGEIRVVLGSTATLGTGVNIQERLHTLIHLDAPNRPMDYTQRNGRILRQGNLHKEMGIPVRVLRFGVEDSLDVTAYQRLKTKGAIADSVMHGKEMMKNSMENRVLEEEEDVFGDTVAQLSGSEYAMLKNNAEKNVRKYESRKKQYEADQIYIHNAKPKLKANAADAEHRAGTNRQFLGKIEKAFPDGKAPSITAGKQTFSSVDAMTDFFKEHNKKILEKSKEMKEGGESGHTRELTVSIGGFVFKVRTELNKEMSRGGGQLFSEVHRTMTYTCPELGMENIPVQQGYLKNAIEDIVNNVITGEVHKKRIESAEREAQQIKSDLEQLEKRDGKPFEFEKELAQAKEQLVEYSAKMKKELEEKEAKYAEIDNGIDEATITDTGTEEEDEDDVMMRDGDMLYRLRQSAPPKRTGIGYKVFVLKDGELYPPMVANPNGEATPVGVWLDADAAPVAGQSKTGRNQVKAGGKGTQGGSGKLAYRPGWHLGEIPYALQFNRMDENGDKSLFPANFVWAEVEYANDVDYQEEAMGYGMNANGKFQHSLAGLPRVPENGAYRYRTNPNPETDPWIITGAMRVKKILTPSEVDSIVEAAGREPQPRQEGAVTDGLVKALNDKFEKELNVSPRILRWQMSERVKELSDRLNLDNVEIVTNVSGLSPKQRKAKGFYTKSSGKISIVIPNNTSLADVEQTLLHEAVAHYGLRKLFGENFDNFLDNVFNNAEEDVRSRIVDLASRNSWDFHKATEEYLASLAERTDFEQARKSGWWQKVRRFFSDMLRNLGFKNFSGVNISDNELRYVLWSSYENLKEDRDGFFGQAADIAKQNELKVGRYADDVLNRDGEPETRERAVMARKQYEERVKSGMYQMQEALQDSMLSLKEAMSAIVGNKTEIKNVDGYENAYLGENRLSSVNKAEADAFAHTVFKPMLDEVAKLAHNDTEREELTDYMFAKHGLERNIRMAQDKYDAYKAEHPKGAKLLHDFRKNDYAGLTALTGVEDTYEAEEEAKRMVEDYESGHDTTTLWEKIKAVSDAILSKSYDCGMMSKDTYQKVSEMYDFYIPLRGFDEKTSSEAYAYLTHGQSAFNALIRKAEGRTSKADDPFANLQSMAESAIMQGNRNKLVKQKFLNFVLNHPSDLVSVSDLWLQYDAVSDEWKPVFPDNIKEDDTPYAVERKMQEFEERMSELAKDEPTKYKHGKDAANIPYRVVESRDLRQHQVLVKRNGKDYVLTVNGNPRAAQALNGQTNPDNDMSGAIGKILNAAQKVNRQLSAFYTTRNPDFVLSNYIRDMLYANSMTWIKERPNYALRFHRNYMMSNPVKMKQLLKRFNEGTLDMDDKTDKMFHQFMMNGGETGYANIRDIEQHKNDIRRELKKANGKLKISRAVELLGEGLDDWNRAIENCARFAAFMTSREMGRSLDRSIYDAKEISVNFNKKGSGAKFLDSVGQTKWGNRAALVSGLGRSGFVFWNASVQGLTNIGREFGKHPAKAITAASVMFVLGALVACLGFDDGDDDDNKNSYFNLPEHVRRSNIIFRLPWMDNWISIPLPVEYRAVYGMGELMASTISGKEHLTDGELASAIAGQVSQILPIDFLEGQGGARSFIPSAIKPFADIYENMSWTGMPIYKDTEYNKEMPEWTKAYKSADKYIVGLSEVLNEVSGGDQYTKGAIDINPAKVEYLLNGYFGGVFSTIDKMVKSGETLAGARDFDPRNIPLINRIVKAGDERTEYRAINNEYFRLKKEHDSLKKRLKHYEEDTDNGVFDYAEKIDFLYNSPEYERYEIFEDYRKEIDALYRELADTVDEQDRKDIEDELNEVKREMIAEINHTRK